MDDRRQDRTARMTVRRYPSSRAADADDLAYWRQMSDAERVLHRPRCLHPQQTRNRTDEGPGGDAGKPEGAG